MTNFVKRVSVLVAGLVAVVLVPASASATTITFNFEELSTGSGTSVSTTQGGLTATIRRQDNTTFSVLANVGPSAFGTRTIGNFDSSYGLGATFVIDFSAVITSASISFGDFGADDDGLAFFQAFSGLGGSGSLVNGSSVAYNLDLSNGNSGIGTLSVSGAGIRSLTFVAGGPFPGSLYVDNLIVESTASAVPEPSSMVLLATGAVGLLVRRRFAIRAGRRPTDRS